MKICQIKIVRVKQKSLLLFLFSFFFSDKDNFVFVSVFCSRLSDTVTSRAGFSFKKTCCFVLRSWFSPFNRHLNLYVKLVPKKFTQPIPRWETLRCTYTNGNAIRTRRAGFPLFSLGSHWSDTSRNSRIPRTTLRKTMINESLVVISTSFGCLISITIKMHLTNITFFIHNHDN